MVKARKYVAEALTLAEEEHGRCALIYYVLG
jgi:hypothetical protein